MAPACERTKGGPPGWSKILVAGAGNLRPQVVEALLMLPSQALLLLCHLDNDLVMIMYIL